MIQRIQSLLFLFAALCNLGVLFFPFWQYQSSEHKEAISGLQRETIAIDTPTTTLSQTNFTELPLHIGIFGVVIASSLLAFLIIFLFKNRKSQMTLGYVTIVILFIELALMTYFTFQGPYEISTQDAGMVQLGYAFPVVSLILIWIGIRRVKKDEDLIRSVDRIR